MVLSSGSTEHGGYHEALIGLGVLLGPGSGVLAQLITPNTPSAGITAIAMLLFLSVIASTAAGFRPHPRPSNKRDRSN